MAQPGQAQVAWLYFWSLRTCLLSGHQALRVEGAFRVVQAEEPGDGAAAGTVRSSAICFLQEGRKRAQPKRADGGAMSSRRQLLTSAENPVPGTGLGSLVRGHGGDEGQRVCGTEAGPLYWGQADPGLWTKKSCGWSHGENAPQGSHLLE